MTSKVRCVCPRGKGQAASGPSVRAFCAVFGLASAALGDSVRAAAHHSPSLTLFYPRSVKLIAQQDCAMSNTRRRQPRSLLDDYCSQLGALLERRYTERAPRSLTTRS